jgi:hypothetical protein
MAQASESLLKQASMKPSVQTLGPSPHPKKLQVLPTVHLVILLVFKSPLFLHSWGWTQSHMHATPYVPLCYIPSLYLNLFLIVKA